MRLHLNSIRARHRYGRRGTSIIWLCLVMLALLGIASFAVDYAVASLTKAQFFSAMDAAGLAAAAGLRTSPAQARANAKSVALNNKINGTGLVLQDSDIVLGSWNQATRTFTAYTGAAESSATAVRVNGVLSTARGNAVPLNFARLFGVGSVQLSKSSYAGFAAGTDVLIIQDLSSSFSTVLTQSKQGDQALLDSLNSTGGQSCFGLVACTGWGQTMQTLKTISGNYTAMSGKITALKQCGNTGMPACSGSDFAAGLITATAEFNAAAYPNKGKANIPKAIVLVCDGQPSSSSSGSHPTYSDSQLLTLAQQQANTAYAAGIHVYVVFYNPSNDSTGLTNLQTLIRGKGVLVQATNTSALVTALGTITQNLPMQILK